MSPVLGATGDLGGVNPVDKLVDDALSSTSPSKIDGEDEVVVVVAVEASVDIFIVDKGSSEISAMRKSSSISSSSSSSPSSTSTSRVGCVNAVVSDVVVVGVVIVVKKVKDDEGVVDDEEMAKNGSEMDEEETPPMKEGMEVNWKSSSRGGDVKVKEVRNRSSASVEG